MTTKALLLPILPLALLFSGAPTQAAPKAKTTPEPRVVGNVYRPALRGTGDANKQRFRTPYYRPTQYYYTRDSVISYRYTVMMTDNGGAEATGYLGPHGALFVPEGDALPSSAAVRNFAAVTRRNQPGVGMAPLTATVTTTTTTKKTTTGGK
jgi:hypothetical protein